MKIITAEDVKFTSKYLWVALIVSFPWIPLFFAKAINPHYDITGLFIPLSVIVSITLIVISLVKKERQILFLFLDALVVSIIIPLPLICVAPH